MTRIIGAGGGGGGGCFLGHTLVRTPDGLRAIETLQPGDAVLSFDDQGRLHQAQVLKVHVHENERVVRYQLWGGAVLDATPNHWVLNQFNAFVEIGTLGADDCLVDENGHLRPIVERTEHGRGTVYNLTVEGHHTFIAGGIRVHNAGLGLGIAGAGGGGGGGKGGGGGATVSTPTEVGDNLNSSQYANLIDLISEGEIEGLKDGARSIYLDNTPLSSAAKSATYTQSGTTITIEKLNHGLEVDTVVYISFSSGLAASGDYKITSTLIGSFTVTSTVSQTTSGKASYSTYNFKNVILHTRNGTQDQSYIPIAAEIEDEKAVGVNVEKAAPVVRSITDPNVDAVRVTISLPSLQTFSSNGDITGATVQLQIAVQYNGGGFASVISDTITGRTGDAYQRDYLVNLNGAFPVNIKVIRVTDDSTSAKLLNAFSWSTYTELTYAKLRYPNSALIGLRVDAEQFSSIPRRSYLVRGVKVRIPNNASVDRDSGRLVYNGVWNGSFGAAQWTTDPAWILWDLLTSTRYGFGDHITASQLDKWAFFAASQYSSELVTTSIAREIQTSPRLTDADKSYFTVTGVNQALLNVDIYHFGEGNTASRPVVVYIHGGAWAFGDKSEVGSKAKYFNDNGYIFVSINYRLSPSNSLSLPYSSFSPSRVKSPTHVSDCAKALAWIYNNIDDYGGNVSKLILIGHSAGAHLVSLLATNQSYIAAAGVPSTAILGVIAVDTEGFSILNQITNPSSGGLSSQGVLSKWYQNAFGVYPDPAITGTVLPVTVDFATTADAQTAYTAASPISHISASTPPFLVLGRGAADRKANQQSFVTAMQNASRTVTYVYYPENSAYTHLDINTSIGSQNDPPSGRTLPAGVANVSTQVLGFVESLAVAPAPPLVTTSQNLEPRFSCNVNIQTAEDAYKLINDMCSVFRAMPYWSTGSLTVTQDRPSDPAYLFTLANVSEDGFSYSGGTLKGRPTVAVVSYLDLELRDIAYEVVENQAAIAKYGVVTSEISAFACTSRGQAQRLGEWLLYSEWEEGEVISFTASIDAGVLVRPGQIIEVADPVKAGQRRGGRIKSATTTSVTIDDSSGITAGNNKKLSVILPSGAVETRNVSSVSESVITVSTPFTTAPNANSVWIYQTDDLQTTQWRVLTVSEQDQTQYAITALAYNASKYDYIEEDRPLQPRDSTNLNVLPEAPTNLSLSETLYKYQGQVLAKVLASWKPVVGVNQYIVKWRKDLGNWETVIANGPDFEILDITPGTFEFEIYSQKAGFKISTTKLTGSINALGKTAPPSDVSNLNFIPDPDLGVLLSWDPISDIDVDQYEIRRGINWASAEFVSQIKATSYKIGYLDDGTYTYLVKAIDTSGVYSTNAASRAVTIAGPNPTVISSAIQGTDLVLFWTVPVITGYAIVHYRVTYGNSYATSIELAKTGSTSFTLPITWTGSRTFWVAPVDAVGKFTDPPDSEVVTITGAAAPTITTSVGGSTATLSWTAVAGTLPTETYEIRQGSTFATATVLANITGTSYTLKATWSGNQTFWVVAKDANGNYGTQGSAVITVNPAGAPALASSFSGQNVVFSWAAIKGTLDTEFYLLKRGATWSTATTVATIKGTAYTLKADWGGTQKFWLAAVDINGTEGAPDDLDVIVTVPSAPTITQQVIDNNVLLRWNDVTQTLPILNYELRKGASWAGGTVVGTKQGGFTTVFETQSGIYTYWLAGIDSAGNYGTPGSVSAIVNQPPDYVLQFDQNSTWAGTETNIYTDAQLGQIVNVNTTETWQSHFTSRGYSSPQDQINAGYTYYLMPSTTTANYVEEFDYGTVLAGTKVTATLTSSNVVGATTITPTISVRKLSTDPWTDYAGLSEVFVTQFRYFKVRYDFASAGGDDLMVLTALNVRLDSKIRNDAGSGTANSGDSGGTTVNFNVPFVDVQSITVTPSSTTSVTAVYDFVDAPNPTSFKVLLFNTSGTRVSGGFSWSARGV